VPKAIDRHVIRRLQTTGQRIDVFRLEGRHDVGVETRARHAVG
jgi:hypothetical protein